MVSREFALSREQLIQAVSDYLHGHSIAKPETMEVIVKIAVPSGGEIILKWEETVKNAGTSSSAA